MPQPNTSRSGLKSGQLNVFASWTCGRQQVYSKLLGLCIIVAYNSISFGRWKSTIILMLAHASVGESLVIVHNGCRLWASIAVQYDTSMAVQYS